MKTPIKAVFLMTPWDEKIPQEVFAYFPEENYSDSWKTLKTSYAHNGQTSPCAELFALECKPAAPKAYKGLLAELTHIKGFDVTVLDAKEFLHSQGKRLKELKQVVKEITADTDEENSIRNAEYRAKRQKAAA